MVDYYSFSLMSSLYYFSFFGAKLQKNSKLGVKKHTKLFKNQQLGVKIVRILTPNTQE